MLFISSLQLICCLNHTESCNCWSIVVSRCHAIKNRKCYEYLQAEKKVSAAVVTYECMNKCLKWQNKCWRCKRTFSHEKVNVSLVTLCLDPSLTTWFYAFSVRKDFTLALLLWLKNGNVGIATCITWNDILRKMLFCWNVTLCEASSEELYKVHTPCVSACFSLWHLIRSECVKRWQNMFSYAEQ